MQIEKVQTVSYSVHLTLEEMKLLYKILGGCSDQVLEEVLFIGAGSSLRVNQMYNDIRYGCFDGNLSYQV